MSEWWKTAKDIIKGKPKGSKLIVLGVFLVSIGAVLASLGPVVWLIFTMFGSMAFGAGVAVYREEAEYELEKKREKDAKKQE
jgi:hypothetical protein